MPTHPISYLETQIGESHKTVEDLQVEAGKVEEFARAIGDDNPAHRDTEAAESQGFKEIPAPLTFLRTSYFPRHRPPGIGDQFGFDLGFRDEYVIHGEHAFEFDRPVHVGDVLSGMTTLIDIYQREGSRGGTMTFAVFETEYRDENEDLVCTERLTRIETGAAIDDGGRKGGKTGDGK